MIVTLFFRFYETFFGGVRSGNETAVLPKTVDRWLHFFLFLLLLCALFGALAELI
jgi:hypothetical protein